MHIRRNALMVSISTLVLAPLIASAWTGPTASPPNGNVAAPVNVGTTDQVKNAGLGVNSLAVFGNAILNGVGRYFNFGATAGSSGYGIRDNAGLLEFKNSGGSWASIQSTVFNLVGGTGSWAASDNNIYNTNGGSVGIGTTAPFNSYVLDVNGATRFRGSTDLFDSVFNFNTNRDTYIRAGTAAGKVVIGDVNTGRVELTGPGDKIVIGNVGIGIVNPSAPLDMGASGFIRTGQGSATQPALEFMPTASLGHNGFFVPAANTLGFATGATERMRIGSSGNVGIGITPNAYKLEVAGTGGTNVAVFVTNNAVGGVGVYGKTTTGSSVGVFGNNSSGSGGSWGVYCLAQGGLCGGDTTWSVASDARLKTNVRSIPAADGLDAIMQLRPVTYHWRDTKLDALRGEELGFIAQEVWSVFPSIVHVSGTTTIQLATTTEEVAGTNVLSYETLVVPLVKAVQELYQKLTDLENTVVGFAQRVTTHELCLDDVCVTKAQLQALLAQANQASTSSQSTPSASPQDTATLHPGVR